MRALVVVDVQSYFLKHGPADLVEKIFNHIKSGNYDYVLFTIFKGVKGSNFEKYLHWSSCQKPEDLMQPSELKIFVREDNVFVKLGYSAFTSQKFEEYLKKHNIKQLDICGVDLEACVLATAYQAFDKGYEVKVLFDLSHARFADSKELTEIIKRNLQTKNDN